MNARPLLPRCVLHLVGAVGLALSSFVALSGCAATATAPSQPAVAFPSSDEVARIPGRKAPPAAFDVGVAPVDSWTFESGPTPEGAAYDDPSPWGELLREQVRAHSATSALFAPLRCAAQEIARFHLEKQALPAESLRRFIAARCGSVAPSVIPVVASAPVPLGIPDRQIAAQVRPELAKLFDTRLSTGHHLVGLAVARDAQRMSFVTVVAEDEARLEPGSRAIDGKRQVTLRGTARNEFLEIGGLVNRGAAGAAPCVPDGTVRPPQFAVRCELAAGDRFAWVEIVGRNREGFLLHAIAETLIYEGNGSEVAYRAAHAGPPAPASNAQEMTAALVEGLNRVRRAASLAPLTLATKQSVQNARLAGTLIDATMARDTATAERAALGLLAGWDVEGLIRSGSFFVGVVAPERDATAWLDFALERPSGRIALLDPQARQIAVGPVVPDGGAGLGAAVTTYTLFESENHAADEQGFFARLAAARAALGLPAPVRLAGFEDTVAACTEVAREGKAPMAALQEMMETTAARTGMSVSGYLLETNDLARVEVPKELLTRGPLHLILRVTHHRAPGAAWGQYVVFAIMARGNAQLTASAACATRL